MFTKLPSKKYQLIMADPPWHYRDPLQSGGASSHYDCIVSAVLMEFPIDKIAEKDSVLLLWATFPQLPVAIEVMAAWGYKYKTAAWVWVKTNKSGKLFMGLGHYSRANAEICLLGVRGKGLKVKRHDLINVQLRQRLAHSEKPVDFYNLTNKLFGDVTRIDLFARQRRPGWDTWGKDIEDNKGENKYADLS